MIRFPVVFACFSVLALLSLEGRASADALGIGLAESELTIVDFLDEFGDSLGAKPDDFSITVTGGLDPLTFEEALGSAFADADFIFDVPGDPDDLDLGDSVLQGAFAEAGSTVPLGFGEVDTLTNAFFTVTNDEDFAITLVFDIEYFLEVDSVSTDDILNFAEGFATVQLVDFTDIPFLIFEDFAISDTDFDDGSVSFSDFEIFELTVLPGETVEFAVFTDASAFAVTVPEPSTIALLGLTMTGLGISQIARRHRYVFN